MTVRVMTVCSERGDESEPGLWKSSGCKWAHLYFQERELFQAQLLYWFPSEWSHRTVNVFVFVVLQTVLPIDCDGEPLHPSQANSRIVFSHCYLILNCISGHLLGAHPGILGNHSCPAHIHWSYEQIPGALGACTESTSSSARTPICMRSVFSTGPCMTGHARRKGEEEACSAAETI